MASRSGFSVVVTSVAAVAPLADIVELHFITARSFESKPDK